MTSAVAAGNGELSHGLYRGMASEAELVLVQVRDDSGRITNETIARGLHRLLANGHGLGVRVVNLSLGGEAVSPLAGNPVDDAVAALVEQGVTVVAAAGDDGERRLVPPGTAPNRPDHRRPRRPQHVRSRRARPLPLWNDPGLSAGPPPPP